MLIEEIVSKEWKGLGNAIGDVTFNVVSVEGDRIETNDREGFNATFDRGIYAPFDFKPGQDYMRQIWQNGEFVSSVKVTRHQGRIVGYDSVGETYFLPKGGKPVKVEGDLNDFIKRLDEEGRKNVYNQLLGEGKILAGVRVHADTGASLLLEVVMAQEKDFTFQYQGIVENVFEAYSILVNPADGTARIIKASYEFGSFNERIEDFKAAKPITLPSAILNASNKTKWSDQFELLEQGLVAYIREKAFCPNQQ